MARDLTQLELLSELQPVAEENLNRHLSMAKEWHPHDYVPWDEGRNFAALGGEDWSPEQSQLDEVAKAAVSRTTGTTTRNRISPVKTPRTVRKNCFMAEP